MVYTPDVAYPSILTSPTVIVVPETGRFVARNNFVKGSGPRAKVPISGISSNFDNWFLAGDGMIEEPIARTALCSRELRVSSADGSVLAGVGGEARAEIFLSQIYFLMGQQRAGKVGDLLVNRDAGGKIGNVFFRKDMNGILRIIYVPWWSGGWLVAATPLMGAMQPLQRGHRVFSRY